MGADVAMRGRTREPGPDPADWGLERRGGRLHMDGHDLVALAALHGTPLHVASARTLRARGSELLEAFRGWPGRLRACYSYKTNPVPGLLRVIHGAGLGAEVVNAHELWLARRLGVEPADVVFNGPNKTDAELREALGGGADLLVVDGLGEARRVERAAAELGRVAAVALRICPGLAPRGMNPSTLTGSARSPFGMEAASGEFAAAVRLAAGSTHLRLRGVMAHIGSGVHDLGSFRTCVRRLLEAQATLLRAGAEADLVDLGGGLGTRRSREMSSREMLAYAALGRLPPFPAAQPPGLFARYAEVVCDALDRGCRALGVPRPEIVLEPGRAVSSDAQLLLLTVGAVRERENGARFAHADGGAMTSSLVLLSEHHGVLLANRDAPPAGRPTSVFGRLPSPLDLVYRNARLPALEPGDILAVMDAGAYFVSTSTSFGGPRPPVLLLDGGDARIVRRRETSEDLARVDVDLRPAGEEASAPDAAGARA
jgi:diaminopimelate decarboxylase